MENTLGVFLNDGLRQSGKSISIKALWLWVIGEVRSIFKKSWSTYNFLKPSGGTHAGRIAKFSRPAAEHQLSSFARLMLV